jgi:hypothetical protein
MGALDFAGGTVVHVNAAVAAFVPCSASVLDAITSPRRSCRTTCPSCCSARPALVRLVRFQRGERRGCQRVGGAGVHDDHARSGGHARRLDAA